MDAIIEHPDVKRMLLQMRSMTAAARTICYATAVGWMFRCVPRIRKCAPTLPPARAADAIAKAFSTISATR